MADAPRAPELPDLPEAVAAPRRRWAPQLIWIIPIVAVLAGGWLAVKAILERGPTITISFKTGGGPRSRQDEDQVQGRRHRPGQGDRAQRGPQACRRHRRARQGRRGPPRGGHAVLGGAAADHRGRGVRARDPALGPLHRSGSGPWQAGAARLRRPRRAADRHPRGGRAAVRPARRRPRVARRGGAGVLPAAAGRRGRQPRARQGRKGRVDQDLRARALRPVRHRQHALLERERRRRVARRDRGAGADRVARVDPDRRDRVPGAARRWRGARGGREHGVQSLPDARSGDEAARPRRSSTTSSCSSSRCAGSRWARRSTSAG